MAIQSNIDAVNNQAKNAGIKNTADTSGVTSSLTSLASNFTNFISLLTTQLKNQDPTSPMETNEFTQELIGFSQVQQSLDTNTNLKQLIDLTKSSGVNNSISYINQLVDANTDSFNLKTGKPIPELSYTLPSNAAATVVSITDMAGNVIKTAQGSTIAGKHTYTWDGTDKSGNTVQDGNYKIKISAIGTDKKDITDVKTSVTDYVSQVDFANGVSTLFFGDIPITTDKINSIKGYYSQQLAPNTAAAS